MRWTRTLIKGDHPTILELGELVFLAVLGWLLGLWATTNLGSTATVASYTLTAALLLPGIRTMDSRAEELGMIAVTSGWALFLVGGAIAATGWVILWVLPGARRDRIEVLLSVIPFITAAILVLARWRTRADP